MKNTMKKLIAFASALSAAVTVPAQSVFGAYNAENVAECEYDELIQMRDKNILIKDGSDSDINDDTQLIVIDENGEKKLIDKSIGINGIYNYVSTTMGRYNYISPTVTPYSFDFMDESYKVSTEQKAVIVGIGDKFALMNNDNEIVSAEYSNICRINDDYFLTDESEHGVIENYYNSHEGSLNSKSGLIKADGTVIFEPTDGIQAFYLSDNAKRFLVSTDNGAYIIDTEGNQISDFYTYVELYRKYTNNEYADNYNYVMKENADRYTDSYILDFTGCKVADENGKEYYLDNNLDIKTKAYDHIYNCILYDVKTKSSVYSGIVGDLDGKSDFISYDGEIILNNSDSISITRPYSPELESFVYNIESEVNGHTQVFNPHMELIDEYDKEDYDYYYPFGYIDVNYDSDEEITVTAYDTHFNKANELSITCAEGSVFSNISTSLKSFFYSEPETEFLSITYDEETPDGDYESFEKLYWLTENQNLIDVSDYCSDYGFNLCDFGLLIGKKEVDEDEYSYVKSYSVLLDNKGNVIADTNGEAAISEKDGYIILQSSESFSVADKDGKMLLENAAGIYDGYCKYHIAAADSESIKYGICDIGNGIFTDPVYDSADCLNSYFREELPMFYIVSKDGMTFILDELFNEVESYDGIAADFGTPTPTPYDTYFPLSIKNNDVITSVVYDVNNGKVTYSESGVYDSIARFKGDYALVYNYDVIEANDDDELDWTGENLSTRASGLIKYDGTALIPPVAGLKITLSDISAGFGKHDVSFSIGSHNYIPYSKKYSAPTDLEMKIIFKPEDLNLELAKEKGYTFAAKTEKGTYVTFKDKLYGMTDADGKELIEPQFSIISDFRDDVAVAALPGYEDFTLRRYYADSPYYSPEYYDSEYYDMEYSEQLTGLITIYGDIAVEPFNNIPESKILTSDIPSCGLWLDDNYIIIKKYNDEGECIQHLQFTGKDIVNDLVRNSGYDIAIRYDDLFYVEKDGLAGVVDSANNVVIPVEYKKILSVVTSSSLTYVREYLIDVLKDEFTPKLRKLEDGSYLANVMDTNGKFGVIKITGNEIITGDVDGDGVISAMDASAALTYYVTQPENIEDLGFPFSFEAADWDKNGIIDARDASAILTYYVNNN